MIDVAVNWDKGDMRSGLEYAIANHMKKCYLVWNKDTVEDIVIFNHLKELSDGQIDLAKTDESLTESGQFLKNKPSRSNNNNNRGKKGQRGRKKRY